MQHFLIQNLKKGCVDDQNEFTSNFFPFNPENMVRTSLRVLIRSGGPANSYDSKTSEYIYALSFYKSLNVLCRSNFGGIRPKIELYSVLLQKILCQHKHQMQIIFCSGRTFIRNVYNFKAYTCPFHTQPTLNLNMAKVAK